MSEIDYSKMTAEQVRMEAVRLDERLRLAGDADQSHRGFWRKIWPELGDRTAEQAWQAGDVAAVIALCPPQSER